VVIRAAAALRWALAIAGAVLAAPACVRTSYTCALDSDCDLGELGRCEVNGRCTVFDDACPARRRYTEHSEELSNRCFDDSVALANPCAGGQPPALAEGDACAAAVCAALPACCSTGWSDACVAAAQLRCELACDTRIALTALAAGRRPELYDLRRTGASWTATRIDALEAALAWLAPAPGQLEPRLAGVAAGALVVVGGRSVSVEPTHAYQTIASVDLDRDGRDTVALSSAFGTGPVQHEVSVVKLDDGTRRTIAVPRSQHLSWGDNDHDAFPDGITGFNNVYSVLDNVEADLATRARGLSATTNVNISNADTPPAPPIRGFDWIDLDRDGRLDLAVFGTQVRLHLGDIRIANNPTFNRDCDPPAGPASCAAPEAVAFAGAALPSLDEPGIAIATFPIRKMYLISVDPSAPQSPMIRQLPDACPACPPLIALAARDLDGDRRIDLVGLDPQLGVHTALAAEGYRFIESAPIPPPAMPFTAVELSVSGAASR
jgi:hypothetical protein